MGAGRYAGVGLLLFLGLMWFTQGQTETPSFRVEVRMVQLEVRVSDGRRAVSDLAADDFIIYEEGVEQEVEFCRYVGPTPQGAEETELYEPVPAASASGSLQTEDGPPAEPTWVYIALETGSPQDFSRASAGIKSFVENGLRPGFRVSIDGLPFTSNRELLLAILDRLGRTPYGTPIGVEPGIQHMDDLEFVREMAKAYNEETAVISTMTGFEREPMFQGALSQAPTLNTESVDRQILFFGQVALRRYLDLIRSIGYLPGKKVVILFRSGLRMDPDHYPLMNRVIAEATRRRVSFYAGDSRGLETIPPIEDRRYPLAFHRGSPREFLPNIIEKHNRQMESKYGLHFLARETNGKMVSDTNSLRTVLDRVVEDSGNYYVLGYYPRDLRERGRFRQVRVEVGRPGSRVQAPRGYFERSLELEKPPDSAFDVLQLERESIEKYRQLEIEVQLNVFAGPDLTPMVVYSLGTDLAELEGRQGSNGTRFNASVLARISDPFSRRLPVYDHHAIDHEVPTAALKEAVGQDVYLSYGSRLPLYPGTYLLQGVFRDERNGRFGLHEAQFSVPDFSRSSVPSSMLLTREVRRVAGASTESEPELLGVGDIAYVPQAHSFFRVGEVVHVLYDLYRPTREDLEAARKGMQLLLMRNNVPVTDVEAYGEPYVDENASMIRYAAHFSTAGLAPGTYRLVAFLPGAEQREVPTVQRFFRLKGTELAQTRQTR